MSMSAYIVSACLVFDLSEMSDVIGGILSRLPPNTHKHPENFGVTRVKF